MHVAAALGVPTLSFHSLGRPEEWAPRSRTAIALHQERIAAIGIDEAEQAARGLLD
jgi:ADP-heptose:LPS heptosyltransferase